MSIPSSAPAEDEGPGAFPSQKHLKALSMDCSRLNSWVFMLKRLRNWRIWSLEELICLISQATSELILRHLSISHFRWSLLAQPLKESLEVWSDWVKCLKTEKQSAWCVRSKPEGFSGSLHDKCSFRIFHGENDKKWSCTNEVRGHLQKRPLFTFNLRCWREDLLWSGGPKGSQTLAPLPKIDGHLFGLFAFGFLGFKRRKA